MPIRLARFEMPKRVEQDAAGLIPHTARFVVEPFEAGYGRTLGNSLRRVLLSSLEGAAISAVLIEGAPHEYCSLPGVVEDVTDIVLNLKQVRLRMFRREIRRLRLKVKGPCTVTAAMIETDDVTEVLNPEQVIATLDKDGHLDMELEVKIGRGYCPAEWNKAAEHEVGIIPIDCLFSPVRRVTFSVENTRVGRRTDYDKLALEITTDGRVTPEEALRVSAAILRHHLDVFVNTELDTLEFEGPAPQVNALQEELRAKLVTSVNEIELSVRAANCLNNANITTVGELCQKTEAEMLKYRNFGKKSLNEIKQKLVDMGLSLGMAFEPGLVPPPSKKSKEDKTSRTEADLKS
jgi:DNA-directed RNA polymerase subunit alpha